MEKKLLTIPRILQLGVFLALLTPFVAWDQVMFPFIFPKTLYFRILVEALFFLYVLLVLQNKAFLPKQTKISAAFGIFVLITLISGIFGENVHRSFFSTIGRSDGIVTLIHYYLFFIIISSVFRRKEDVMKLLYFLLGVFFIENIIGIGQLLRISYIHSFGSIRPNGTLGNPAFFSAFLVLGVWISAYTIYSQKTKFKKTVFVFAVANILLSVINIFFAENRGGMLALAASFLVFAFSYLIFKSDTRAKKIAKRSIAALFILIVVALVFGRWNGILNKYTNFSLTDITIENRLIAWEAGWKGFLKKPLLGWGQENYYIVYNEFYDPNIIKDAGTFSWYDRAHNTFIDIMVSSGLFGLFSYLGILGFAAYEIIASKESLRKKTIILCFFLSYFISTFFLFDTINSFLVLVVVLSFLSIRKHAGENEQPPLPRTKALSLRKNTAVFMCFLFFLSFLLLNVFPAYAAYNASKIFLRNNMGISEIEKSFETAFRFSSSANQELRQSLGNYLNNEIRSGRNMEEIKPLIFLAVQELQKSAKADPYAVQTRLILSELARASFNQNSEYLAIAKVSALEALALSPKRYHAHFSLGKIFFTAGMPDEGLKHFQKTLEIYPEFVGGRWNLAIAYILLDEFEKADKEIDILENKYKSYLYESDHLDILAEALIGKGEFDRAANLYITAIEAGYEKTNGKKKISDLYEKAGNPEKASGYTGL